MFKFGRQRRIYLDNGATTPVREEVFSVMKPFFARVYGNAGSIHHEGVLAEKYLENAREEVATSMNSRVQDIVFTTGGTSGNNISILGLIRSEHAKGVRYSDMHIVTTNIEHSSVREVCKELVSMGVMVTEVPVRSNGIVSPRSVREALRENTVLVSVMYANNEIGTIQPIKEIAREVRHFKKHVLKKTFTNNVEAPFFHVDACQAPAFLSLDTATLGADIIVIDGQKIYGPKGVGVLWVRPGVSLLPIFFGGGQERGLNPGTENITLAVGMGRALSLAQAERARESARLATLRDFCISEIEKAFPKVVVNGDRVERLPNNINVSFPGYDTELLVLQLDARGISCSTKSACLESGTGSYVVSVLGGGDMVSKSTIRFSLGRNTTKKDIDFLIKMLSDCLKTF